MVALVVLLGAGAPGCSTAVVVPDGVFACTVDDDCPDGFSCRANRCYRTADGSVAPDASVDDGGEASD